MTEVRPPTIVQRDIETVDPSMWLKGAAGLASILFLQILMFRAFGGPESVHFAAIGIVSGLLGFHLYKAHGAYKASKELKEELAVSCVAYDGPRVPPLDDATDGG